MRLRPLPSTVLLLGALSACAPASQADSAAGGGSPESSASSSEGNQAATSNVAGGAAQDGNASSNTNGTSPPASSGSSSGGAFAGASDGTGASSAMAQPASSSAATASSMTTTSSAAVPATSVMGGSSSTGATTPPRVETVFIILMENKNWSDILGSDSSPYINNQLLPMASSCSNYKGAGSAVHPSEPNYLWLEAGDNFGITNDKAPSVNHQATTAHLVTLLKDAGISWKSYQEDIPGTDCPVANVDGYAPKHNPMVFFDDVTSDDAYCISHVRPFGELAQDLAAGTVARYNFITPNLCDDMHNLCSLSRIGQGDDWLAANIPVIMGSAAYRNNGAIFITWDESEGSNPLSNHSDNTIGMMVVSPLAKGNGFVSSQDFRHGATLRSMQQIFGVTPFLGAAASSPDLSDLFNQPL